MFCEQKIAQQSRDQGIDQRGEGETRGEGKCVKFDESFEAAQGDPRTRKLQLLTNHRRWRTHNFAVVTGNKATVKQCCLRDG
jgi:hypothetical protein